MIFHSLQQSVYQLLTSSAPLVKAVKGIYDQPPQEALEDNPIAAVFPYIIVGDDKASPWDTDTEQGFEAVITLHIWTRYAGRTENKKIQNLLYNLLHRKTLPVPGYATLPSKFLGNEILLDADGLSQHGIMHFQILADAIDF